MAVAWVLTIPAAAAAAALVFATTQLPSPALAGVLPAILGVALAAALAVGLRRTARGRHLEPQRAPGRAADHRVLSGSG